MMNRLNFMGVLCRIGIAVSVSLIALSPCIAEAEKGSLSGVVIDTKGKPITGFNISLSPALQIAKTDENGAFTFTDVPDGPAQIMIPPQQFGKDGKPTFNLELDNEIVSIKIGGITLYQDQHPPFGGIKFSTKPGSHFKNIAVTVRPRMRIRTRVVFKDGEPLRNASIFRVIMSNGTRSGGATTDTDGYFVHYIDDNEEPVTCKVSVKYKGLSAESEQFEIKPGGRHDNLVLTLDGEAPPAPAPTQSKRPKESLPGLLRKLRGGSKLSDQTNPAAPNRVEVKQVEVKPGVTTTRVTSPEPVRQIRPPWEKDAWAVNPANGHAYKKIQCRSLADAKNRAAAEGAHLVAINDEAEQKWLSGLFGNHLYWIGLSDAEKEGEWVWQNGEPLTYSNWGDKHSFPRSTLSPERRDGAVMTFVNGQWHAVGPGDLFWRTTKRAILEKEVLQTSKGAESK